MRKNSYDYIIGSADPVLARAVSTALRGRGFISAGEARSGPLLLRALRSVQPWLVVVDTALPPGDVVDLAKIIEDDALAAALYLERGFLGGPEGYPKLKWPFEDMVLMAVAETLCSEFARKQALYKKVSHLQNKLRERKAVEKAKGIITKELSIREEKAYRLLQKSSMDSRITLAETAEALIKNPEEIAALRQLL